MPIYNANELMPAGALIGVPVDDPSLHRDDACPCQSGLKYKYCCGLLELRLPTPEEAGWLEGEYQAIKDLFKAGKLKQAHTACIKLLSHSPTHVRSLRLLYMLHRQSGNRTAAEILAKRLITLLPQDDWAYAELAMLFYESHDLIEAELNARNVVRVAPDNPHGHNLMGMILTDEHHLHAGEFHYRRALTLQGPTGKLCANLALNLKKQGKLDEADKLYRRAMELEPDNMTSLMGWHRLKEGGRKFETAQNMLEILEQRLPANHISVCMSRSVLCRRNKDFAGALAALDSIEPDQYKNSSAYYYERGEVLDKLCYYDEAIAAVVRANTLVRERGKRRYAKNQAAKTASQLKSFFTQQRVQHLPKARPNKHEPATPIFITGFPRSGMSMVEQLLASHKEVSAGDELNFIWELAATAPKMLDSNLHYPECLADLCFENNQMALETFRDFYLKKIDHLGIIDADSRFFTDRTPLNETNLGLIHLVFPEAPVIHLVRHPLDVVLSCYFNDLGHGNNMSYDLQSAAKHYILIRDLLNHYLKEMNIHYLPIRCEDIMAEPEPSCRKLLEFIDVEWDPRCLDFHQNTHYGRTASYARITEQLHGRPCYHYIHYLRHLEPVIPILEPAIRQLGYTIESA